MKTQFFSYGKHILLFFVLTFIVFGSCKKDDEQKAAPALPPESSFIADFSDFTDKSTVSAWNWGHAAWNVGVWNTIIMVGLAVPVASFREAFNHEAVQLSSDTWQWSYSFTAVNVHLARLTGKLTSEGVEWKMYISKEGHFSDFLWYEGFSQLDRKHGTWTLYESPTNPVKSLGIEWNRESESVGDIQYTNIKEGADEKGGYIKYGLKADDFDAFYLIYNKGQDNLTQIEWSRSLKNGFVIDPKHFGDENKHCWDNNLQDITCPE